MKQTDSTNQQVYKQCGGACNETLPISLFHKRSAAKDGLQSYCKQCNKNKFTTYYQENTKLHHENTNRRLHALMDQGLCTCCDDKSLQYSKSLCSVCYLKQKSRMIFGDQGRWTELFELAEQGKFYCHYTGAELVPGLNLSFDHKNCKNRYPEQAQDMTNIVPCDVYVNISKNAKEYSAFVEELKDKKVLSAIVEKSVISKQKKVQKYEVNNCVAKEESPGELKIHIELNGTIDFMQKSIKIN